MVVAFKGTIRLYKHLTDFNKLNLANLQKQEFLLKIRSCVSTAQGFLKKLQNVKCNLSRFGFAIQELPSERSK